MNAEDQIRKVKMELAATAINTIMALIQQKYAVFGDKSKGPLMTPSEAQVTELENQIKLTLIDLKTYSDALQEPVVVSESLSVE